MGMGAIGGGIQMGTGLLGSWVDAYGARHAAETQANAGQAGIQSERNAVEQGIRANAYATQGQRGIGDLAMYRLASMLGIDPRQAFPGGGIGGSGGGNYPGGGSNGLSGVSTVEGGRGLGSHMTAGQNGGVTSEDQFSQWGGITRDPLHLVQNYQFTPYTMSDPQSLMGPQVRPGAPGDEFGELNKQFSMQDFFANQDPAYGFRQQEGSRGIENSAAARGMQLSGSNLKDLTRFNQDLASTEYQNAFNRDQQYKMNEYNWLVGLMTPGLGAEQNLGSQTASMYGTFGQDANQSLQGIGNVLGAGQYGALDAVAQGIIQSGRDTNAMMGGGMGGMGGPKSGGDNQDKSNMMEQIMKMIQGFKNGGGGGGGGSTTNPMFNYGG